MKPEVTKANVNKQQALYPSTERKYLAPRISAVTRLAALVIIY